MHAFTRGPAPACLATAPRRLKNKRLLPRWDRLEGECRQEVRLELVVTQDEYCAYCERRCDVGNPAWHVDHFRPQSRFPNLTMSWDNLVASCGSSNHCGHFKDSGWFDTPIDPSRENPLRFLQLSLATGDIIPRLELCRECCKRANGTIRLLGLNHATLRTWRRGASRGIADIEDKWRRSVLDQPMDFLNLLRDAFFDAAISIDACPGCGGPSASEPCDAGAEHIVHCDE